MERIVRRFNERGLRAFRDYLRSLDERPATEPPMDLLEDPNLIDEPEWTAWVGQPESTGRYDMARYLDKCLPDVPGLFDDRGLWAWLSLFLFDHVCPADPAGNRRPGRMYRHILEGDYRHGHRHLLAGPLMVYRMHGDDAAIMLTGPVHAESRYHHEIASRQDLVSNRAIVRAATILYYDRASGAPRPGGLSREQPGNLYRFVTVLRQLAVNYDLYATSAERLIDILPPEFDRWRPPRERSHG